MREKFHRGLIPASRSARILMPSPACDGTSVPTPNVAGDRRLEGRSLVGRLSPGGPVRPQAAKHQQWCGPVGRRKAEATAASRKGGPCGAI